MRRGSRGIAGAALAACMAIAAGCGASKGPQVAQIGTTTTPATSSSNNSNANSSSSSSSASPAAFSACMRKHGVTDFPDPDSQGRIKVTGGSDRSGRSFGVDPNSPTFRKAQQACQKLSPKFGRPPTAQELAREKERALAFAACMRAHGVPKFPDPTFSADGGQTMKIGPSIGVDPRSPQFRKAQQTCQKDVPGGGLMAGAPPKS